MIAVGVQFDETRSLLAIKGGGQFLFLKLVGDKLFEKKGVPFQVKSVIDL